ncbi:uncharacterized protein LOC144061374 [Vanacampus margaritifer]
MKSGVAGLRLVALWVASLKSPSQVCRRSLKSPGQVCRRSLKSPGQVCRRSLKSPGQVCRASLKSPGQVCRASLKSPGQVCRTSLKSPGQVCAAASSPSTGSAPPRPFSPMPLQPLASLPRPLSCKVSSPLPWWLQAHECGQEAHVPLLSSSPRLAAHVVVAFCSSVASRTPSGPAPPGSPCLASGTPSGLALMGESGSRLCAPLRPPCFWTFLF